MKTLLFLIMTIGSAALMYVNTEVFIDSIKEKYSSITDKLLYYIIFFILTALTFINIFFAFTL